MTLVAAALGALHAAPLDGPREAPLDAVRAVGLIGLVAAVIVSLVAVAYRPYIHPLPVDGVAMAVAGLLAVAVADDAGGMVQVLGIIAAGVGAGVGRSWQLPLIVRPALVLPGAAVTLGATELTVEPTVRWPTVIVASVLAVLVADADESLSSSAAGPPLLAVSICGMYATIPETSEILAVLVVAVPIALVGAPLSLARLGAAGSGAVIALLAAVVAEGGQTRSASIVGGLACTGVLALEPVARRLVPLAPPWPDDWRSRPVLALAALQVVVVLVMSRVAGLRDDLEGALAVSAVAGGLALVALVLGLRLMARVPEGG
jgi:hypothetical protein